jgi:hypothetical protein
MYQLVRGVFATKDELFEALRTWNLTREPEALYTPPAAPMNAYDKWRGIAVKNARPFKIRDGSDDTPNTEVR